jgi:hypothetical protein
MLGNEFEDSKKMPSTFHGLSVTLRLHWISSLLDRQAYFRDLIKRVVKIFNAEPINRVGSGNPQAKQFAVSGWIDKALPSLLADH